MVTVSEFEDNNSYPTAVPYMLCFLFTFRLSRALVVVAHLKPCPPFLAVTRFRKRKTIFFKNLFGNENIFPLLCFKQKQI